MLTEQWGNFRKQFNRGRKARNISKWDFQELLSEDFEDLKKIIFHIPVKNDQLIKKIQLFER